MQRAHKKKERKKFSLAARSYPPMRTRSSTPAVVTTRYLSSLVFAILCTISTKRFYMHIYIHIYWRYILKQYEGITVDGVGGYFCRSHQTVFSDLIWAAIFFSFLDRKISGRGFPAKSRPGDFNYVKQRRGRKLLLLL